MPQSFQLRFEVTREDWLVFNEALMHDSTAWNFAAQEHRRVMRRQALWIAPFLIVGAALFIGRGQSTQGMYLEGAVLGACFSGFLYFTLPRLYDVDKAKKAQLEQIQRMDLSAHSGTTVVAMDEHGVHVQTPSRQLKLTWPAVAPSTTGSFVLLQHGGSDGTIIPARAFASEAAFAEFIEHARRWWEACQLPHSQRLERYLSDRDLECPRCKYNLRGMRGEACPECGEAIQIDAIASS